MKEIIAVYQDCVLCGEKGRQEIAELARNGVVIRKVGFTTEEGKELIHKAVFEHGIGSMPFYVEGDFFSTDLDAVIWRPPTDEGDLKTPRTQKIVKRVRKKAVLEKKTKITDMESGNGADSEG